MSDPLTNILNRRGFLERFNDLLNQRDGSLVVGILDVNDFKGINDTLGHINGDAVLGDIAEILSTHVAARGICARFGGDEFVFAVKGEHRNLGEITQDVSSWFNGKTYSVSVGCAVFGDDGEDWNSCLHEADKRLYAARRLSFVSKK